MSFSDPLSLSFLFLLISFIAHALQNPQTNKRCDYFDLSSFPFSPIWSTDQNTLKELSQYGLDILRNEEDSQVCFGVNLVDNTVEVPIGVVVRHFEPEEIVDYLLPLKKMKYLGVEVLVPSNPVAFLEKLYEDKNDVLKEVDLFKETSSKMDQWKKAGIEMWRDV